MQSILQNAKQSQWFGVGLLALISLVCWALFMIFCPSGTFGSPDKLLTYLQRGLIYAVGSCGLYFIVVMGLWDFSIGAMLILSELMGVWMSQTMGYAGLIVAPIVTGIVLGLANGVTYRILRIPSLIVTVGLSLLYESFGVFVSNAGGTRLDSSLNAFGSYPWNLILALAAFFLCGFILKYTKVGTYVNAIGTNELTAKNMGVNVDKYKMIAFVLCGMFCGIMGILYISYGTAQTPQTGMLSQSLNFIPLMGTFFGLAFRKFGHPIVAIVLGEFLISMMLAGFVALSVPLTINNVITGATLLLIVSLTTKRVKGAVVK